MPRNHRYAMPRFAEGQAGWADGFHFCLLTFLSCSAPLRLSGEPAFYSSFKDRSMSSRIASRGETSPSKILWTCWVMGIST
jgi:hypothetical protein